MQGHARKFRVGHRIFQISSQHIRHREQCWPAVPKIRSINPQRFLSYPFLFPPLLLIITVLLQGCGSQIYHIVEPGETLYSISWAYGHDYKEVAKWNDIHPPYIIRKGQRLRVIAPRSQVAVIEKSINNKTLRPKNHARTNKVSGPHADKQSVAKPVTRPTEKASDSVSASQSIAWQWPIRGGKLVQTFNARTPGKQGVDVAGNMGQPVYSAAPGQVVYSGGGLNRYGKLIIVKHNDTFLSAYAHNKRLLVQEGERLKAGQIIAEMGSTGTNTTKLHFEIRRNGKPVDPLKYLPKKMQ